MENKPISMDEYNEVKEENARLWAANDKQEQTIRRQRDKIIVIKALLFGALVAIVILGGVCINLVVRGM